jgi:hypothetical protein
MVLSLGRSGYGRGYIAIFGPWAKDTLNFWTSERTLLNGFFVEIVERRDYADERVARKARIPS